MSETVIDTPNPSVKWILIGTEENLQTWKQETTSSGVVPMGEGQTQETITITRTYIGNQSKTI